MDRGINRGCSAAGWRGRAGSIALENYAADPFHRHDVRKVKGCPPEKPRYRIRIGEYRATFRIIQDQLVMCVVAVGKKKIFEY
jgi:mRNA interferase RelE/StbE